MRYALRADIEGKLKIGTYLLVGPDGLSYELHTDEQGWLTHVRVGARVVPAEFAASVVPEPAGNHVRVEIKHNPKIKAQLLKALQALESELSFAAQGALQRLRWDRVTEERIPETDEERSLVSVPEVGLASDYPPREVSLSPEEIRTAIEDGCFFPELTLPKAFLREGMNEFSNFRYIQAFYNFFFVIEGFYSQGKSAEKEVLKAFASSPELTHVTEWAFDQSCQDERHKANLLGHLQEEHCQQNPAGIQKMILRARGRLHHFPGSGRRRGVTPFSQAEFESVSWLLMRIASYSVFLRRNALYKAFSGRQIASGQSC